MNDRPPVELFLSSGGNDTWSGSTRAPSGSDGPLATLHGAVDRIRRIKSMSARIGTSVTITVLDGVYELDNPVTFGPSQSGTVDAPVVLRAASPKGARLISSSTSGEPPLRFEDANHIRMEGFILENGRGDGIRVSGGEGISLSGLTVRNIGNKGIIINEGCDHSVASCHVAHIGKTGIDVSGGDRRTLERCDHEIVNNHVHAFAEGTSDSPGIKVSGVGTRIAHNHIHDAPHGAIGLAGNEHLIEKNHIHNVCNEAGDSGALYTGGRDWTERGNVIRYNLIHDTRGPGRESRAITLDDCASGSVIHGNIFYNCTIAVFIGGGRNHHVTNNIFADCEPAVVIDGRGTSEKAALKHMVNDIMRPRFEMMNPLEPPYSIRYPDLREVAAYYFHELGIPPEGNLISRNICIGEWLDVREPVDPKLVAAQRNFTVDPGFADLDGRDFHLDASSEVYEYGFKPIPLDDIGLIEDKHRVKG